MSDWVSSLLKMLGSGAAAAAILGVMGYILRDALSGYISEKVAFKNKQKITELEDKLTRERQEIADLRQITISGVNSRNEKLLEKQISTAEKLWRSLISNKKHEIATKFLQSINIEEMNKHIGDGSVTQFVNYTARMTGVQNLINEAEEKALENKVVDDSASLSRPFVSPLAWSLYSAHNSIIWHAVLTIIAWKNEVTTRLLKNTELVETAKLALPHQKRFLDEYGVAGTYYLLDELEEAMLNEIKRFLKVGITDQEALANAKAILAASNRADAITHPSSAPK